MIKNYLWAAQWRSKNQIDGEHYHIIRDNLVPILFTTKNQCAEFIKGKYGYISTRKDLRGEPHGWKIPIPVKVKVVEI